MKQFLSTFLKGKLEGLSWGTLLTTVISERTEILDAFNSGGLAGASSLLIAGASLIGAIWGRIRRGSLDYIKK